MHRIAAREVGDNLARLGQANGSQGGIIDAIQRGAEVVFNKTLAFLIGEAHASEGMPTPGQGKGNADLQLPSFLPGYLQKRTQTVSTPYNPWGLPDREMVCYKPVPELFDYQWAPSKIGAMVSHTNKIEVTAQTFDQIRKQCQATQKPLLIVEILDGNIGHARIGICTSSGNIEHYSFGSNYPMIPSFNPNAVLYGVPITPTHTVIREKPAAVLGRKALIKAFPLNTEQMRKLTQFIENARNTPQFYNPFGYNCKATVNAAEIPARP